MIRKPCHRTVAHRSVDYGFQMDTQNVTGPPQGAWRTARCSSRPPRAHLRGTTTVHTTAVSNAAAHVHRNGTAHGQHTQQATVHTCVAVLSVVVRDLAVRCRVPTHLPAVAVLELACLGPRHERLGDHTLCDALASGGGPAVRGGAASPSTAAAARQPARLAIGCRVTQAPLSIFHS